MSSMATLPLFPLQRVLVPGEMMMLHVFESRFRTMMEDLEDDRFGIVLIRDGAETRPGADYHDVGTLARIVERRDLADGRILLAMVGEQRFAVVDRLPEEPYPAAMVLFLGEGDSEGDAGLVSEVRAALQRYMVVSAEAGQGGDVHFELSSDPVTASYQVASAMRLVNPERQDLLELPTARSRLERERALLGREVDLLERLMQES